MARIVATESVTLDGVMQGLGRADEDTRDGFAHGGWGDGFADDTLMEFVGEGMQEQGAMLFGRRTYDDLLRHWTSVTEPNPFTDHLTAATKYVVSRKSDAVAPYPNSTVIVGEAVETVATLKTRVEGTLSILGSGELVRALHTAGLIDSYALFIHPITLGSGTRLFGPGQRVDMHLDKAIPTTTGLILARYDVLPTTRR